MSRVGRFLTDLWDPRASWFRKRPLPPISYPTTNVVQAAPAISAILPGTIVIVAPNNRPRWVMFQCPCNCGTVITLSLQLVHKLNWKVSKSIAGRPSLRPSVWRDVGCLSHFILEDGRVYWCGNTGTSPDDVDDTEGPSIDY